MKKGWKWVLAVVTVLCMTAALIPAVSAAPQIQNGFRLQFNSNLSTATGNFWLGQTGHTMVFRESSDGDDRISLTVKNNGSNNVTVRLRVVTSTFACKAETSDVAVDAGKSVFWN